jgi:L-fucose isomerase
MRKPKIGVLGFSDGEPEVHEQLKGIVQEQLDAIVRALRETGDVEVETGSALVHSVQSARQDAMRMAAAGVDGTIFSYGVFSFPNFSAVAARNGKGPFLLAANLNPDWPGMVAMLASGGALHHLGIEHFRVAGDIREAAVLAQYLQFARCARVVSSLNGSTYGLVGGRSLGMYSATASMQQWQRQFGVDIEHIDQSEILRLAAEVPEEVVEKGFAWLSQNVGQIRYHAPQLTPEKLKVQIRHYEATRTLVQRKGLDFLGVKCHYEMSRHYCTQCLSQAFMNDPYDWHGPKEPTVFSCEADSDGALTMQILKLLTGDPVIFMDVRHWDKEYQVMVFCNCGSQATWYAARSSDPRENLRKVTFYPALEIYAGGGAHVNLMTSAGEATIARLNRTQDTYRMDIIPTEFVELPPEKMSETTAEWPHVFARLPFDHQVFLRDFDANHCHAVYGNHVEELRMVCAMLGIEARVMGQEGR